MQFKTLAFLSILSILLFTGCDSKEENEETTQQQQQSAPVQKVERDSEFQLKTTNDVLINIKLENEKIILKDYPNKIVLLNFFTTWCPPCKAEIPNLINLQNNKPLKAFEYNDKGSMATIGRNKAVVDLPNFHFSGVFAWFVWMFVHLISLIGFKNKAVVFLN